MEKENAIGAIKQLRRSLIVMTITVLIFAAISFNFSEQLRGLLLAPGEEAFLRLESEGVKVGLIFLTPAEALLANLRLSFITSFIVTLPLILFQILGLAMTFTGKKRRNALLLSFIMYLLFLAGIAFAYFVVLRFAMNFFIGFSSPDLVPHFSIARYISFSTSFILSFGLVFQLPVLFWFLGSIGLVKADFLRRSRRVALLIIVIFAAILTPPDVFSQILMAIPLMLLYELGIFMVFLVQRKKEPAINESD